MPEDNQEDGVTVAPEASPAAGTQAEAATPPAESQSAQPKVEQKHVPYSRFSEVVSEKNKYKEELARLRGDGNLARQSAPSADDSEQEDLVSKYAKKLQEKGLNPEASGALAEVIKEIAKQEAKERYAKEMTKAERRRAEASEQAAKSAKDIADWEAELHKEQADYAEVKPLMEKEWEGLDEAAKRAMVSSKKAFETLYKAAKAAKVEQARAEGQEQGRQEAYQTKNLKSALSSTPGTAPNPDSKFKPEDLAKMSSAEYKKNRDKIMRDLGLR